MQPGGKCLLPRKVSAMQWLILTEGLPVGAWREKIGLPNACELCPQQVKETLQHTLKDCPQLSRAWDLFRDTRRAARLPPSYLSWLDISRGLMRDPPGPQVNEEMRWDTASAFSLNADTPWDILRAQLLWSIWCQRVAHTFRDEKFHLGVVLWHAWRNTIYCAMEAYKELFRHKRNEEKRHEIIDCFQQIWTAENIFGRLHGTNIKWNITPPQEFLPRELGAWTVPPIRINRLSPSPDIEAEFVARPDFGNLVDAFLRSVGNHWQPPVDDLSEDIPQEVSSSGSPLSSSQHSQDAQGQQQESQINGIPFQTQSQGSSSQDFERRIGIIDQSTDNSKRQVIQDDMEGSNVDREKVSLHSSSDLGIQLQSRPKKCCHRKLNHPSRQFKGEEISNMKDSTLLASSQGAGNPGSLCISRQVRGEEILKMQDCTFLVSSQGAGNPASLCTTRDSTCLASPQGADNC